MIHLPDLRYDCQGCGKSCRIYRVEVTPDDRARYAFEPLRVIGQRTFLDAPCVYLDENTRCSVHAVKPMACKDFPFHAVPTPEGVFIGASFMCPAILNGLGRPVEAHREQLEARFEGVPDEQDRWPMWGEVAVDWPTYKRLEAYLASALPQPANAVAQLGHALATGSPLSNEPAPIPDLGRLAGEMLEWIGETPQDGAPVDCARYLEHLLFRKTLLLPPDLFSRAAVLAIVPELVRQSSYDVVEGKILLHAKGLDGAFQGVAKAFL